MLSERQRCDASLAAVLDVAVDLTKTLEPAERYQRILAAAHRVIPFDSACLLRLDGTALIPVASSGLIENIRKQRFERLDHPRFDIVVRSTSPVRFRPNAPIADPFDGFLEGVDAAEHKIHACIGCPVTDAGEVVGVLAVDALDPKAFDGVDNVILSTFGALAGAAMRTEALFEALHQRSERRAAVVAELHRTVEESIGGVMIGTSESMRDLLDEIGLVAPSSLPVLIMGETGVGKELVAHRVHSSSERKDKPFIQVNCAALPASIAESELFGHVRGAFTGAEKDRLGKFEIAEGGTLLLDEIGELPIELQGKLLRVLQNGEIQRVGSDEMIRVDVRVVAATNRDLEGEVRQGAFRADLYHRLAAFPIHVPPLRERRDDIPLLASHFVARSRRRLGLGPVRLSERAKERLIHEPWMGNIRELDNVVGRGVLRASKNSRHSELIVVDIEHLDVDLAERQVAAEIAPRLLSTAPNSLGFKERCDSCKREQIEWCLKNNDGNWAGAARDLGMHRSNLHRLASRLNLIERD
jgi:anaerobic nitric oxide reductase transcription regulator